MKILLIDDSRIMRAACEPALTRAGYQVVSATDGEEGLQRARDSNPDLILLDMMLPKMSGLDLLQSLKRNPATSKIPVIVFTSLSQRNEARLLQVGAAAYLEKTEVFANNSAGLIQTIGKTLERTRAAQGQ